VLDIDREPEALLIVPGRVVSIQSNLKFVTFKQRQHFVLRPAWSPRRATDVSVLLIRPPKPNSDRSDLQTRRTGQPQGTTIMFDSEWMDKNVITALRSCCCFWPVHGFDTQADLQGVWPVVVFQSLAACFLVQNRLLNHLPRGLSLSCTRNARCP
jgi:hypothetical protein